MTLRVEHFQHDGYEQVVNFSDDDFECYIALHRTKLGPAMGGCRVKPYLSKADALADVLLLSESMTYKSSLAGLNLGGGKCVVIADRPTREIMLKVGEAVNYFSGDYITAEDVGTTLADIAIASEVTTHTVHWDGSLHTAMGVLAGIRAATDYLGEWGNLDGVPIWIQGLGKVGMALATLLQGHTNLYVSDIRRDLVDQATPMGFHEIGETDRKFIAVYAPCAMGQVVNAGNLHGLSYSIICGSANNQLADASYAEVLRQRRILYAPDYLVNAGGVISGASEIEGWSETEVCERCDAIGTSLLNVLKMAEYSDITPLAMANMLAEARLA